MVLNPADKVQSLAKDAKESQVEMNLAQPKPGDKALKRKPGRKTNAERAARAQTTIDPFAAKNEAPKSAPEKPKEPSVPTAMLLKHPIELMTKAISAKYFGDDRAAMKGDMLDAYSQSLGAVVDKYFPNSFDKYGNEIVVVVITGQWLVAFWAMRRQQQEHELKMAQMKAASAGSNNIQTPTSNAEVMPETKIQAYEPMTQ